MYIYCKVTAIYTNAKDQILLYSKVIKDVALPVTIKIIWIQRKWSSVLITASMHQRNILLNSLWPYALIIGLSNDMALEFPQISTDKLMSYIHNSWIRQYLVNFTGLADIVSATVYKTKPIFTHHGHGILSSFLTLLFLSTSIVDFNLYLSSWNHTRHKNIFFYWNM